MKKQATLICQLLLLNVCSAFSQLDYQVIYTLQGKSTGQSILICTNKKSVYTNVPMVTARGANQVSSNEVIVEAMKRVNVNTPIALNKKNVLLHYIDTGKILYAEDETPYKYTVEDEIPQGWQVMDEFRKLGSYTCQKATVYYRGRQYIVWFTKAIPYPAGPWELAGLPGLILEATSTDKQYQFLFASCVPLKSNPAVLINELALPKLTYQQYIKRYDAYYQSQADKTYKEVSSGFLHRFGLVKVSPISMNTENIDKNLQKRFVSTTK